MPVDYTTQLAAIARALEKPAPWSSNPWTLATFSAVLGLLGGLLGQYLLTQISEGMKRRRMRKMMYIDVTELLSVLHVIVDEIGNKYDETYAKIKREAILINASILSDEYIAANRDIYMRVQERQSFQVVQNAIRRLLEPPADLTIDVLIDITLETLANQFKPGRFSLEYVRRHLGSEEHETVKAILRKYQSSERE